MLNCYIIEYMLVGEMMLLNAFTQYFADNLWLQLLVDGYLILMVCIAVGHFIFKNKTAFDLTIINFIVGLIAAFAWYVDLRISKWVFLYASLVMPFFIVTILAPELRRVISVKNKDDRREIDVTSSAQTKESIIDSVLYLSARKIGALITVEKNISLDQYADKAIQLNSDVSRELLIQIFTPNTPLHDGAVIIRGNKIRCAGAYYVLAQQRIEDKTTGSRHRAGIGISEVSDALTIIVSEETGNISLAIEGVLMKANEREKIQEYLDMFLK